MDEKIKFPKLEIGEEVSISFFQEPRVPLFWEDNYSMGQPSMKTAGERKQNDENCMFKATSSSELPEVWGILLGSSLPRFGNRYSRNVEASREIVDSATGLQPQLSASSRVESENGRFYKIGQNHTHFHV